MHSLQFTRWMLLGSLCTALGGVALAQQTVPSTSGSSTTTTNRGTQLTATEGERELTLGASGVSNNDFNDSGGGLNASYGMYLNERALVSLRQSITYSNPANAGTSWNGSTRFAFDYHFPTGSSVVPFIGVNVGRVYGDTVTDSWAAGLEGGAKFYVRDKTFIFALAEYAWLAEDSDDIDDTFDDGQFQWSVGIGFNF